MFWLKQCPKCGGDLADYSDHYGVYISCVQCGRCHVDVVEVGSTFALTETMTVAGAILVRRELASVAA